MPYSEKITKTFIQKLPIKQYEGEIKIIAEDKAVTLALDELYQESILGFDTESRPAFRKGETYPPSILQLSGATCVYLFQLQKIRDIKKLTTLLEDVAILKVGVAIRDDIKKLQQDTPFSPAGFIELSDFTRKQGIVHTGLRNLTALFLNFRISKGAQITDWSKSELSKAQIRYATTDAWVSRELFLHLQKEGIIENPLAPSL